jgi:hypothetical protein
MWVIASFGPLSPIVDVAESNEEEQVAEEVEPEWELERLVPRIRILRYTQATDLDQLRLDSLRRDNSGGLPYADPIYWAALTITGAW